MTVELIAAGVGATVAGVVAAEKVYSNKIKKNNRASYRYLRLLPNVATETNQVKILRLVDQFAEYRRTELESIKKGKEWFRFLIHKDTQGNLAFYFGYPEDRTTGVKRTIKTTYPDCELHDVEHQDLPITLDEEQDKYGGYFDITRKGDGEGLALQPYTESDLWEDILYSLDAGTEGTQVWLDIMFSPGSSREMKKKVQSSLNALTKSRSNDGMSRGSKSFGQEFIEEFKSKPPKQPSLRTQSATTQNKAKMNELDLDEQEKIRSIKKRYTGRESTFKVSISLLVNGQYASSIAQTAATNIKSSLNYDQTLRFVRDKRIDKQVLDIAPMPRSAKTLLMTGPEFANICHLPDGQHRIYQYIPHLDKGQRSLEDGELTEGIKIGKLQHPLQKERDVRIPFEQFTKHFVLTGMTGSGKSSTAMEICQSLINGWIENPTTAPGFSYFDPASETVATILNRLLKAEKEGKYVDWSKVHYFNFGDSENSLGLNLLHKGKSDETDSITSEFIALMKYAYGGDTPQMDRILRNAVMTLVDDTEPHNILGIVPLLQDEDFRKRIIPRVRDPIIRQFWTKEFKAIESKMDIAIGPILNRLSPFTTNKTMRRMFGQSKWSLNLRKMMDEGHIILFDLKGLSDEFIKLAGGHLLNQYHKTVQTRGTGSKVHVLMIDEAHKVQIPVEAKIIAEDRKFGLCLGIISQFIGQFQGWLVDAITENVGTVLTCTQGMKSSATVSSMTAGHFDKQYLQSLPERVVAVYTKTKDANNRSTATTFTIESDPPFVYAPDTGEITNYKNEHEMSRSFKWGLSKGAELQRRDSKHSSEVDKEIDTYLNYGTLMQTQRTQQTETSWEIG